MALIGTMLGGGLLYAGISQAQDIGVADQAERTAELVAASGGPASPAHLIPFAADRAAVDPRDDDVAPVDQAAASPAVLAPAAPAPAARGEATDIGQVATAGSGRSAR